MISYFYKIWKRYFNKIWKGIFLKSFSVYNLKTPQVIYVFRLFKNWICPYIMPIDISPPNSTFKTTSHSAARRVLSHQPPSNSSHDEQFDFQSPDGNSGGAAPSRDTQDPPGSSWSWPVLRGAWGHPRPQKVKRNACSHTLFFSRSLAPLKSHHPMQFMYFRNTHANLYSPITEPL